MNLFEQIDGSARRNVMFPLPDGWDWIYLCPHRHTSEPSQGRFVARFHAKGGTTPEYVGVSTLGTSLVIRHHDPSRHGGVALLIVVHAVLTEFKASESTS
jgi:hypothetical protein